MTAASTLHLKIERIRALHREATETENYDRWLAAVRAMLERIPELLDEVDPPIDDPAARKRT